MPKSDEKYSEKEAQARFLRTLKVAVNTPPKPLKKKKKTSGKKKRSSRCVAPTRLQNTLY